ncbi:hypothetical protein DL762_007602 [Monosporascus cannonballus]|uniref:ASX DEUBAD domain-containing protein n=1 Tax=Monosporascus cannonballus TaxID=155416 RepID=A0ABY0H321_9PEZI|nr:hypothetical protein DL762_007602 [Monosporascus cannonballus]
MGSVVKKPASNGQSSSTKNSASQKKGAITKPKRAKRPLSHGDKLELDDHAPSTDKAAPFQKRKPFDRNEINQLIDFAPDMLEDYIKSCELIYTFKQNNVEEPTDIEGLLPPIQDHVTVYDGEQDEVPDIYLLRPPALLGWPELGLGVHREPLEPRTALDWKTLGPFDNFGGEGGECEQRWRGLDDEQWIEVDALEDI